MSNYESRSNLILCVKLATRDSVLRALAPNCHSHSHRPLPCRSHSLLRQPMHVDPNMVLFFDKLLLTTGAAIIADTPTVCFRMHFIAHSMWKYVRHHLCSPFSYSPMWSRSIVDTV